jgi:hypothetical protein
MELDALYVDTAIRRWQRFTGLKARSGTSGITPELEQRERPGGGGPWLRNPQTT